MSIWANGSSRPSRQGTRTLRNHRTVKVRKGRADQEGFAAEPGHKSEKVKQAFQNVVLSPGG